ncbi:MAG TPA: OmpW family outer membrane protein [Thermoanaerobaculia bacterium]|nr:OmpW family outer membrane protein [Thermoanaerobaculia bacterium]
MKRTLFFTALLTLMITPAFAQSRSVDLTGWVSFIDPSGSTTFEDGEIAEFDSEQGFGLGLNVFWSNRVSTEFAAYAVEPDLNLRATDPEFPSGVIGSLEMMPITGTLQFHFSPDGRVDPYIGAGVAYVLFDSIEGESIEDIGFDSIDFDDDYGFLANAGVSIDITRSFALNLDAKYVPVSASARAVIDGVETDPEDFDVNPLILSAGVSLQF